MSESRRLEEIRTSVRTVLDDWASPEVGTLGTGDALNELRVLADDGAQADGTSDVERWRRLGTVVETIVSEADPDGSGDALRALLRQMAGDLRALYLRAQTGSERRSSLLRWIWLVLKFDMASGGGRLYEELTEFLDREATVGERRALEDWLTAYLDELPDSASDATGNTIRRDAGFLLLRLLWDELSAEERLDIAESTGQVFPQMSTLLALDRTDEAVRLAEQLEVEYLPDAILLFGEYDALGDVDALLPDPEEPGVWPELACNLAGALLELGEAERAREWVVRAIRDKPTLDFIDFWREHADRLEHWEAVADDALEVLEEEAPLTSMQYYLREEELDRARACWRSLAWHDGSAEHFEESSARRVANMAKRVDATRLAVEIGMVCARFRLRTSGADDEQALCDIEESRQLLSKIGADEALEQLESEVGDLAQPQQPLGPQRDATSGS